MRATVIALVLALFVLGSVEVVGAQAPPSLELFTPDISGLTVSINGVTLPGSPGVTVTRIHWDWGDGFGEDHYFPDIHTYSSSGTYTASVASYQSDGLSTAKSVVLTLSPVRSGFAWIFAYDDGTSDVCFVHGRGTIDAVKFTVENPVQIAILRYRMQQREGDRAEGKAYVLDSNFKPVITKDIRDHLTFESDWYEVNLSTDGVTVGPGDFYIGWEWTSDPSTPWLCDDKTAPVSKRSYTWNGPPDEPWGPGVDWSGTSSASGPGAPTIEVNHMIRVVVQPFTTAVAERVTQVVTVAVTQPTTITVTSPATMSLLSSNESLLLVALAILIPFGYVLGRRTRRREDVPQTLVCPKCRYRNPPLSQACRSCGQPLSDDTKVF